MDFKDWGKHINKKCLNCEKEFLVLLSRENGRIKETGKPVRFCSFKCSSEFKRERYIVKCCYCGIDTEKTKSRIDNSINSFCSDKCSRKHFSENPPHIKGDGTWRENGYVILYNNSKNGIKEHRKVMQDNIGRELLSTEIVHHIDNDVTNNDISNLQILTRSEHSKIHRKKDSENGKKFFGRK